MLLILAIWAGQIAVPYLFENVLPRKIDYRTYYLRVDSGDNNTFKAKELEDKLGDKGWILTDVVPDPYDKGRLICFFHRQTILKWDRR